MIAKSSTNPVFLSARTGAEAAARSVGQSGVTVKIDWLTPPNEDGAGAGPAHRAGGERRRERDPRLLLATPAS